MAYFVCCNCFKIEHTGLVNMMFGPPKTNYPNLSIKAMIDTGNMLCHHCNTGYTDDILEKANDDEIAISKHTVLGNITPYLDHDLEPDIRYRYGYSLKNNRKSTALATVSVLANTFGNTGNMLNRLFSNTDKHAYQDFIEKEFNTKLSCIKKRIKVNKKKNNYLVVNAYKELYDFIKEEGIK